jgi:hypothetical protein
MGTGRRVVWLVVVVGIAAVAAGALVLRGDTLEPVEGTEAQALLDAVRTGCEAAASAIQSGSGTFTVHDTMWQENGARRETEGTYQLVQRADRVRVLLQTRTIADEWGGTPGQNAAAGSQTVLGFDGEEVTYYEPDNKRASVADRSSGFGNILDGILTITHAPGHAIPAKVFDPRAWRSEWASPPQVLGRETVNGEQCVVVEVAEQRIPDKGTFTPSYKYWISPTRGFSLVRFESHVRLAPSEEPVLTTRADIETVPAGNGLWRISSWRQDQYTISSGTGKPYLSNQSTVTYAEDYQLNAPVTDEMLTIHLPSGTRVRNELIDSEYTVP